MRLLHHSLQARAASGDVRKDGGKLLRSQYAFPANVERVRFAGRSKLDSRQDFKWKAVRARRLDDGLCCLTEDAAVQLHRIRCSFITSGSPLQRNDRHPSVIRIKMSALHVATSHFYYDKLENSVWFIS